MSAISQLSGNAVPNIVLTSLGFDNFGMRDPIPTSIDEQIVNTAQVFPNSGINGAKIESLSVARLSAGSMNIDTYVQSTGYVAGTSGWRIDGAGNAEFNNLTLTGGVINYGKTSFSDSTHAGYYISSAGFYIGAASDTTKLKYTLATGLFDFIGTVSSRSTATLASSINSSGNLVTDVINARLDSSAKTILAGFTFGASDYSGAVNAGTVTWNTTTGAITGGSGVVLYRGGIVGVNAGSTTFSIDATTGAATFAGTLSAAAGTLGALSIASGGNIRMGQTDYNTGTGFWLGDKSGTAKFSIGDGTANNSLTWDGTTLKVNGSAITNSDIYGSGVDGTFTLDGTNTYASFFSKSGSNYTLLQDIFADTLTLSGTATLTTNGYRIFVKNTLTIGASCVIKWNGNNATSATNGAAGLYLGGGGGGSGGGGGAGLTSASLYGSLAGKDGQSGGSDGGSEHFDGNPGGTGANGTAITNCFNASFVGNGGAGGAGGRAVGTSAANGGSGGSAGSASATTASKVRPYSATFAIDMFDRDDSQTLKYLKYNGQCGGSGGGGGGAAGSGSDWRHGGGGGGSGGNGSGGGTIVIAARIIANSGSIQAVGGNGGNGGNGGAGGTGGSFTVAAPGGGGGGGAGCGGPGGVIVLVYSTLSGSGTTSVVAGSNGTPGTKGAAGTDASGHTANAASDGSSATSASAGALITLVV